jgi:PilZ domain
MQVSSGRTEKRIAKAVEVTGYRSDGLSLPKGTLTENVSTRGARIVTTSKLEPGGTIDIHFPYAGFRLHGRVVYCQQLFGGKFAAGLVIQDRKLTPES